MRNLGFSDSVQYGTTSLSLDCIAGKSKNIKNKKGEGEKLKLYNIEIMQRVTFFESSVGKLVFDDSGLYGTTA